MVAHQGNGGFHIVRTQHRVTGGGTVGGTGVNAIRRDGHRRTERSAWVGQGITHLADPGTEVGRRLLAAFLGLWHPATVVRHQVTRHDGSPSGPYSDQPCLVRAWRVRTHSVYVRPDGCLVRASRRRVRSCRVRACRALLRKCLLRKCLLRKCLLRKTNRERRWSCSPRREPMTSARCSSGSTSAARC